METQTDVGQILCDPYNDLVKKPGREKFAILFNAEEHFMVQQDYIKDKEKQVIRGHAVQILDSITDEYVKRSESIIDPLIPYTAMTYFDRFLSREDLPVCVKRYSDPLGNTGLFVICCLTIAWKFRDKSFNLLSFLEKSGRLYSAEDVFQMELNICRGLQWRMRTLTPFFFVHFLIPLIDLPPSHTFYNLHPLVDLIVRSQQSGIAFAEFRPSVMAVSAMITVYAKWFPADQFDRFNRKILNVEPLRPLTGMIEECIEHLVPLSGRNRNMDRPGDDNFPLHKPPAGAPPGSSSETNPDEPKAPALEYTSRSVTQPIPIPGREPPAGTDVETARSETGCRPAPSETQPDGTELEPMPRRRPGKEPVSTSEIQEEASLENNNNHDQPKDDANLEWEGVLKDAHKWREDGKDLEMGRSNELVEEDDQRRDEPQECACLPIKEALADCFKKTTILCQNVKGMMCNIQ